VNELLEREHELAAVEELLKRRSGMLTVETGVGMGKTSLVQVACRRARELGYDALSARGSELEADFAFGVVRQLFERRLTNSKADERASLLVGPAAAVEPLISGNSPEDSARDSHFEYRIAGRWIRPQYGQERYRWRLASSADLQQRGAPAVRNLALTWPRQLVALI
jgi:hypothetical protein